MEDSIFTRIVRGDIPCHKVYEDEKTLAFLDIHPIRPGHVLVVPKVQVDHLWDLEPEDYQAVMATCQKVANRIREVMQSARVGVHVIGFDVPHAHVQLFPLGTGEDYWVQADMDAEPDHAALAAVAQKLVM
jgi:histidine triad (HIT) family protein